MRTEVEEALSRSAVYFAFALGFGSPDGEVAGRLAGAEGWRNLGALLGSLGLEAPAAGRCDCLLPRYQELFGHTVRSRVPPYETEYGGRDNLFSQAREVADVGGFLAALGLSPDPARHERADHVQCECELMAFLARKEAWALEQGDEEMLAATRAVERLFLRDHLGRFAPAFGRRLSREDGEGFYGALGQALQRFVEHDCARLGVAAGGEELGLRLPVVDEAPMACAECPAAEGEG